MAESSRIEGNSCCSPRRGGSGTVEASVSPRGGSASVADLIYLEGSSFLMGTDEPGFPADGEGPVREITLSPFWMSPYAVTNAAFATFIEATSYQTEAERFGWSYVFYGFLPEGFPPTQGVAAAPWWRQVFGADWQHPEGPHSGLQNRMDHPVVHVSWNDAVAYASWAGGRLPTEAEWEYAARGGLVQNKYPWGDRLSPKGKYRCNIWQGTFPTNNTVKDGYAGTAPVGAFEPNGYGLYNMTGNTWEWCSDWFSAEHDLHSPSDPQGPGGGQAKVTKGGSYLCHASYCNRYRVAARTHNTPDSSTGHIGFRLARDTQVSAL